LMDANWISSEKQVEIINRLVHKNDTLVHLGDVGNIDWVKKLNGYKVLITGNHDAGVSNYQKKFKVVNKYREHGDRVYGDFETRKDAEEFIEEYEMEHDYSVLKVIDDNLFDEVYDGPLFINDKILLSHEPISLGFGMNIHGHDHGGKHQKSENEKWAQVNMAANVVGYTPMRLDKIIEGFKVTDIHRQTIDRANINPLHKR